MKDIESRETFAPLSSMVTDASGRTTIWYFPLGAIVAASVVLNVLHPPAYICVAIDVAVLAINGVAIQRSGCAVPWWVYLIIILQLLQTFRDASYIL